MPRASDGPKFLFFVTGNRGKFIEAREPLAEFGIKVRQRDLDLDEPQSNSIEHVAKKTAISAFEKLRRPLFLEDAGLFVDALNGFPGVYSSYVYSSIGISGLLKLLDRIENRKAKFKSCVAFISRRVYPRPKLFSGEVEGYITHAPRGRHGFGFDPIFIPSGFSKTFAEMEVAQKNMVSHRSKAIRAMGVFLSKNPWALG